MEFPSACTQCHSRITNPHSKCRNTDDGAAHNSQPCSPLQTGPDGKAEELHIPTQTSSGTLLMQ